MLTDDMTCPKCFTGNITVLEKKESYHLDQGVYYKIISVTLVCKKGCWHNWHEYYKIELKNFADEERITRLPIFEEEIITPGDIKLQESEE
ncbi:MAG: hypothetical protein H7641_09805 [Candidatus Heimdallarchaeota archaeon]|nr:hypothetical protein [Candidatus Heimdallarchaeota archaeon]MCK4877856.1 hypothetical protein [Candidatus Heimdallarchaeota archaeon]